MSEPTAEEEFSLPDLSGATLERIARLCGPTAGNLDPDDLADRAVLHRALLRVRQEAERADEIFAGHGNRLL